MKKVLVLSSAVAAVMLSSCMGDKETPTTFKTNEALEAVNVKTKNVSSSDVDQLAEFTANVEADKLNNIMGATLRIRKIHTEVGRNVSKGQLLVELDDYSLASTMAQVEQARKDFARTEELYKIGNVSESSFENAKMQLENAERGYRLQAENTRLVAPCNGVVTARYYDAGDMATGPVLSIAEIAQVKLMLDINESYFKAVEVGMPIHNISIDAYPGETFEGKVNIVYPTLNPSTRTFQVEVVINNAKQRIRPGMFARVTLNFGTENHVLVPDQAVVKQTGSGERFVYVINGGKAYHKTVELGRRLGDTYEVLSGINAGDQVVVFGQTLLSDGRDVNVLN